MNSADERWLGQTISTSFTLTVESSPETLAAQLAAASAANSTNITELVDEEALNTVPQISGLQPVSLFSLEPTNSSSPYEISLGRAFDQEGDEFTIEFDNNGLSFVRLDEFDEGVLVLVIDNSAEPGLYTCLIKLTEENESSTSTEDYKIDFIVPE